MNKAVTTTIATLSFCFNAFAQEAKGKDWTEEEWKKEKGSYGWVFPHIDKDTDGTVTAAEYKEFQMKASFLVSGSCSGHPLKGPDSM